jgi:hypothetical protein
MPAPTAASLVTPMLSAMKFVFGQQWPQIKDFAGAEARKLATSLAQIMKLRATGQISEAECAVLLEMQKNTARSVLLALQGMGLLLVEQAINAALAAVRDVVNTAIGFPFL